MSSVCVVSDSTTLFPNPVFAGRSRVHLLPATWQGQTAAERLKAGDFPLSLKDQAALQLATPSAAQLEAFFRKLGAHYDGVLMIVHAERFGGLAPVAAGAAASLHGSLPVRVIDSGTLGLGLGLLVQAAAEAAEAGLDLADLDLHTRNLSARIYGLLCVPALSYLQRSGLVNPSQAMVGEYLKITQVYTLEEGELMPSQKTRNARHLVDALHEFLSEFDDLEHVAIMQGVPAFDQETRALRERLLEERGALSISEQTVNAPVASFVGPHSLGIFALER